MTKSLEHLRLKNRWPIFAVAGVVLVALVAFFAKPLWHRDNPLLTTPKLALEALSAKVLYYNEPAGVWLTKLRPELLTEADKNDPAISHSFAQAVEDPKLFRQLDRQNHFDTLLLVGNPSQYHPLLEHLLETKDWTLTYLDHTSLIFKRGAEEPWTEAKFAPVRAHFAQAPAREQAMFLSDTAMKLLAVQNVALGKKLAEEAQKLDPKLPNPASALAQYHLDHGEWDPAIADADRALELDSEYPPALAAKAQALYASKHFSDAYHVSDKLIEKIPDDPGLLFYHAKICHEARAFGEEIKALEKLIAMAEANHRATSGYNVYLGQAYARSGQGEPALKAYAEALSDPDLPKDQRQEVEKAFDTVRSHMGKN